MYFFSPDVFFLPVCKNSLYVDTPAVARKKKIRNTENQCAVEKLEESEETGELGFSSFREKSTIMKKTGTCVRKPKKIHPGTLWPVIQYI